MSSLDPIDADTIDIYTAKILDSESPGYMEELQRKVVEGNGTLLFDMVCLMGFIYTVARGAPNPLEDESKARVLVEKHSKRV